MFVFKAELISNTGSTAWNLARVVSLARQVAKIFLN
jgi:hypothetical protein